ALHIRSCIWGSTILRLFTSTHILSPQWNPKACRDDTFSRELTPKVDVVVGAVTSLRAEVQELRSQAPREYQDMSALDAAMAAPPTVRGPIDVLFEGLGHDEETWRNEAMVQMM
ncbi:hypothetical protein HAX54_045870, partial [Datura stramonium]|nr:hypothetical protein [Datura stramonium]